MKTARTAIRLLRQFTPLTPELGVSDIAKRMSIDKASAHRLLRSLAEEGVVEQDESSKRYRLGLGILDFAAVRLAQFGFIELATPYLERLRDQTGETVALLVRDRHELVCIYVIESAQQVRVSFYVGERAPVHCTAAGIVFLSQLPEDERAEMIARSKERYPEARSVPPAALKQMVERARRQGYAIADDTYIDHVRAAAAPVRDSAGRVMCCVAVAAPRERIRLSQLWARARETIARARDIENALRGKAVALMPERLGLPRQDGARAKS